MVFWIAILSGALFVWLAIRMGFYETWVLLFNIVISIYVSIFLTPILVELVPVAGGAASYHTALCMIVLAGGGFAVLQGLSFVFLTGQFHIPFPRVFDVFLSEPVKELDSSRLPHRSSVAKSNGPTRPSIVTSCTVQPRYGPVSIPRCSPMGSYSLDSDLFSVSSRRQRRLSAQGDRTHQIVGERKPQDDGSHLF